MVFYDLGTQLEKNDIHTKGIKCIITSSIINSKDPFKFDFIEIYINFPLVAQFAL